jgi:hypothetical protein
MYVVRRNNEWLTEYATGGYYWSGPGLSPDGWKTWAAKFANETAAQKVAATYGGVVERV